MRKAALTGNLISIESVFCTSRSKEKIGCSITMAIFTMIRLNVSATEKFWTPGQGTYINIIATVERFHHMHFREKMSKISKDHDATHKNNRRKICLLFLSQTKIMISLTDSLRWTQQTSCGLVFGVQKRLLWTLV